jgi:hypothetical protein
VAVVPDTVQMVGEVEANVTGLPEAPPVALRVKMPPVLKLIGVAGAKPVMVWAISDADTVNDCETCGAALKLVLPA